MNLKFCTFSLIAVMSIYFTLQKPKVIIHMIGDSTMANKAPTAYPETGWGQVFHEYFTADVSIHNHAINGYSTRSFIEKNKWQPVLDSLKEGDYVFMEFGHNDEKTAKLGGSNLEDFRKYLIQYVLETRAKKAIPILMTPIMRRVFKDSTIRDTHGGYPDVTRSVAQEYHVLFIDMHRKTERLFNQLGVAGSQKLFNWVDSGLNANYPRGVKDNTHLSPTGAHQVAELAVAGIKENIPQLAKYLK